MLLIFKINASGTDTSSRLAELRALMRIAFEPGATNETSLFSEDATLWFTAIESDSFGDECNVTLIVTGFS